MKSRRRGQNAKGGGGGEEEFENGSVSSEWVMVESMTDQIVISIVICIFSMRIYAGYDPFVDGRHDELVEAAQWQLFFALLGSLCIR